MDDFLFEVAKQLVMEGKRELTEQLGRVCVGGRRMLILEIMLHYALAELQLVLLIIIIFMGKGTCNSLVFVICLRALVCQIGNQCQLSTVGVHGWCVCVCALLCVCPWRWRERPHPRTCVLLLPPALPPMCQEL